MKLEYSRELTGGAQVTTLLLQSQALQGNALGDPTERSHPVLIPAGETQGLPLVFVLGGYTSFGHKHLNKGSLWEETLVERLGRLMAVDAIPSAVFVWPSCETRLGGSQFMNSIGTGNYEDMLVKELLPAVEKKWSCGGEGNRVVVGKSSGGFGALTLVMRNPGLFRAAASHCGDMAFDVSQRRGFPEALTCWKKYGGPSAFLKALPQLAFNFSVHAGVEVIAMSTCYSPNLNSELGCDLPVDPETGVVDEEVFSRWLKHDPVQLIQQPESADGLRRLDALYLDAGESDEFALQWGLRRFLIPLKEAEIEARVDFFDGGHFHTDARYEVSLPFVLVR